VWSAIRARAHFRCIGGVAWPASHIADDSETIGDSEAVVVHLSTKYELTMDAALGAREGDLSLPIARMLDDLYWAMSFAVEGRALLARFRNALMREHPRLTC
jgi:hypothetical protein